MIKANGLSRNFGDHRALENVSFELAAGQTLVVFGPNGAGKTTLLRILATLLTPSRGNAEVFGHKLPGQAMAVRPKIGYLGHEPLLYRELSAKENLRFYSRLYGLDGEVKGRIDELLDSVEITYRADEPVKNLSKGMTQRVALCRAVLHSPQLLLLDEPGTHLDPAGQELVGALIGKNSGLTRVVVSHSVESGLSEADMVLLLKDGLAQSYDSANAVDAKTVQSLYR